MKKILLALILTSFTGLLFGSCSHQASASQSHAVNPNACTQDCPTCCPTCNPCVPDCLIAGCFQVGPADASGIAPVVSQRGCKFIVTPLACEQYLVSFEKPFCHPMTIIATGSQIVGAECTVIPAVCTSTGVTVTAGTQPVVCPVSSFVLQNILPGSLVCFFAVPFQA